MEGIATPGSWRLPILGIQIEVVDLVWKGLRPSRIPLETMYAPILRSLTWFGRDCDIIKRRRDPTTGRIEVVDLVWKGLRLLNLRQSDVLKFPD